jgi:hypothetical protein
VPGVFTGLRPPPRVPAPEGFDEIADERAKRQQRTRRTFLARLRTWSPAVVFLVTTGAGLALFLWSALIGLAFVKWPVGGARSREVGFVRALNWSATFLALFPFAAYLMLSVLQWIPDMIEELGERGMVRDRHYQLVRHAGARLVEEWERPRTRRTLLLALGWLAIALSNAWQFKRLLFPAAGASTLIDWRNVAIASKGDPVSVASGVAFDAAAYVWQVVALGGIFTFFVYVTDIARLLRRHPSESKLIFVPDLASDDKRRGFELFEGPLKQVLMVAAIAYVIANLASIQASYLPDAGKATSLWEFVRGALLSGVTTGGASSQVVAGLLTSPNVGVETVLLTLGTLVLFACSFVVLAGAVQGAAVRAQRNARAFFRQVPTASLSGKPAASEWNALSDMQMWPLTFPTPYLLISLFAVALLALIFYGIGVYLFGVTLVVMIGTVIVRFIRRS